VNKAPADQIAAEMNWPDGPHSLREWLQTNGYLSMDEDSEIDERVSATFRDHAIHIAAPTQLSLKRGGPDGPSGRRLSGNLPPNGAGLPFPAAPAKLSPSSCCRSGPMRANCLPIGCRVSDHSDDFRKSSAAPRGITAMLPATVAISFPLARRSTP
jgi:hypothetical protein